MNPYVFLTLNRDALQKFFYPFDYQEIQATKPLVPGQRRVHTGLDVKFDFECDSTLDILFSKNRVRYSELLWVLTLRSMSAVSLQRSNWPTSSRVNIYLFLILPLSQLPCQQRILFSVLYFCSYRT